MRSTFVDWKKMVRSRPVYRYLYAVLITLIALGIRMLLLPLTGVGAPFLLFFLAALLSGFMWGVGPGILSGLLATFLGGFLFVYQAHFSVLETLAQCSIFLFEMSVLNFLADRFFRAKHAVEEEELRKRRLLADLKIFRALVETSSDFIGIADPEGNPVYVNPAGRAMVGMPSNQPVRETRIPEYYPPETRAFAKNVIYKTMIEKGIWSGETLFRNWKTEDAIPVSDCHFLIHDPDSHAVLGMATITRDISNLRKIEAALRERERELSEAQRVAHIGSWSRDAEGNVLFWSEELYRIFGVNPGERPPALSELSTVYTAESLARVSPAVDRVRKEGVPYEMDLEVSRPSGIHRWVHARAEPMRDGSGRIVGFRGIAQDITEIKELQRLRDEWTAVIAHDLRQPISVIRMSADLLSRNEACQKDPKLSAILLRIHSTSDALATMVNDLLDTSQLEAHRLSLERDWIDPRALVRDSISKLEVLLRGFQLRVDEGTDLLPVFADRIRIEQILTNLISNAVKYGTRGTEIVVQMIQHPDDLEVLVKNHGRGIPAEEITTLFSRFSRSKTTRGSGISGLGLGLYISKGLVEAHGGRIWVESTPGQTTAFHFTLPCRASSERAAA